MQKNSNRNFKKGLLIGCLSVSAFCTPMLAVMPTAHADWIDIAAGIANGISQYDSALNSMLTVGNNALNQNSTAVNVIDQDKLDLDDNEVALVNKIMSNLLSKGDYVMDNNALPFRWNVTNVNDFNASCHYNDYINVYRGLLIALNYNEDEIASVLGHEMIHGLHHHAAKNYAKKVLQEYGASFFYNLTSAQNDFLNVMMNYNTAKNFTLPSEEDADASSFYIITSAGYNPGGIAAYQRKVLEIINKGNLTESDTLFMPNDHPRTGHRLELAAQQLEQYGYNHVTVKNDNEIYIDNQFLLRADSTDTLLPGEAAYFIAGAIDKGLHNNRLAAMWDFRQNSDDTVDFLDNDPVFGCLKTAINQNSLGASFEKMITDAYHNDSKTGNRDNIYAIEKKRLDDLANERQEAKKYIDVKKAKANAAAYNDLHLPEQALNLAQRIENAQPDNTYIHVIRGNSYAELGDFDKALKECNLALASGNQTPDLLISRAKTYYLMGNNDAALADCSSALHLDTNLEYAYKLQANIFNQQGNHEAALKSYKKYKYLEPAATDIPEEYLSEMN